MPVLGKWESKEKNVEIIIHILDADEFPEADIKVIDEDIFQLGEIIYDIIHSYDPTPSTTLYWEKRNNVNAKEYGYYVRD
jgi:tetrahydromethanopterin S-methyltransferase subunit B